jgi:hypothetical protein
MLILAITRMFELPSASRLSGRTLDVSINQNRQSTRQRVARGSKGGRTMRCRTRSCSHASNDPTKRHHMRGIRRAQIGITSSLQVLPGVDARWIQAMGHPRWKRARCRDTDPVLPSSVGQVAILGSDA